MLQHILTMRTIAQRQGYDPDIVFKVSRRMGQGLRVAFNGGQDYGFLVA